MIKEMDMDSKIYLRVVVGVAVLVCVVCGESSVVLWNEQCPPSFGETAGLGQALKSEIPDFHSDFRLQFDWPMGKPCSDPNERLSKEISLTKKVLCEVFRPGIVPIESIDAKFLALSKVSLRNTKENALVVRFRKGDCIIKLMKFKRKIFVTFRRVSGEAIDVKQLSGDIFNPRILPAEWEKPLYFGKLKRESKVLRGGAWMTRQMCMMDSSGNLISADDHVCAGTPVPLGEGLYARVDFYTNGRFVSYQIAGGPNLPPVKTVSEKQSEATP